MNNIKLIDNPIDLYVGWGWCNNVASILWDNKTIQRNSHDNFKKYIDYIEKTINFQCVIIARYFWGTLFIDLCDLSEWEIEQIEEPHVYLKLQYNPNHKYKNNVKPFTYFVNDPIQIHSNIHKYREIYKNTYKSNLTYGRWTGISQQRYNIAKKMRSLGIMNGGEYCTTPRGSGYDDHEDQGLLDSIKPREKMCWDEYFKNQCFAMSALDAMGFGDMTHRMIESFAIGIPLIRPKLINQTINPIIINEHYLDCGKDGKNLQECLEKIKDEYWKNKLINNGIEWYENNACPSSFYNLILKIINDQIKIPHLYKYENYGEDWFSYPKLYSEMVYKFEDGSHFVELGSWKGKSSCYMATEIANSNKKITFDCIDTWGGSLEHGEIFKDNNNLYDLFINNMKHVKDYYRPIRMETVKAHDLYKDQSLDFIFIDADHSYEAIQRDIKNWYPKLKQEGIIAGHDYTIGWPGVVQAVDEFFGKNNIISKYDCWIYSKGNTCIK